MIQPRNSSTFSILLLSIIESQLSKNFGFIATKFKGCETVLKSQ